MKGIVSDVEERKFLQHTFRFSGGTGESFSIVPLLKVGLNVDKIFDFEDGNHINKIVAAGKTPG